VTSASGDAVSVLLNDFNVQPEAVADSYYTNEDTPLNVFGSERRALKTTRTSTTTPSPPP
jgi:hypothetical protein